jgi:hypothetical protein
MRFRNLRRVLQGIVVAGLPVVGLPVVGAGCDLVSDCYDSHARTFSIQLPAEAQMQFRIDRCAADPETCMEVCQLVMERELLGGSMTSCEVDVSDSRAFVFLEYETYGGGSDCPVEGRRPAGLAPPAHRGGTGAVGAWLAQAAWLEAASVYAFAQLARELEGHGAPNGLVLGARAAARDEVRHTALVTRLALRYGARPATAVVAPATPRPLVELAMENIAEGCVRETWGAVIALWQASTAGDPVARATFRAIARDEARHAALAWAIDRWIQPQLDASAIERVHAARVAAARELLVEHAVTPMPMIGLPGGDALSALVSRANRALWGGVS